MLLNVLVQEASHVRVLCYSEQGTHRVLKKTKLQVSPMPLPEARILQHVHEQLSYLVQNICKCNYHAMCCGQLQLYNWGPSVAVAPSRTAPTSNAQKLTFS